MIGVAGGIRFAERRPRLQVAGKVGQSRVERGLHVARRAVDVAGEIELDGDPGVAERAARGQLAHAGDLAKPALQRRGDGGRHGFRIGARPGRGDVDGREIDRRHAGDGQEAVGHRTRQKSPMASRVVPTGRRMKGSENPAKPIASLRGVLRRFRNFRQVELGLQRLRRAQARLETLHCEINDRASCTA